MAASSLRTGKNALRNTSPAAIRNATRMSADARRGKVQFKQYSDNIPF
ncbi:unnamed protein product [marine sediment metagenome]|uniref:Uncharacterized protein n=1 Tax=marine sediment metagenome TaxID=412755 RepID=X0U4A8_9ZZZZ